MNKIIVNAFLILILLVQVWPSIAEGSLQDDYSELIAWRIKLEKSSAELHKQLRSLERVNLNLEALWDSCANGTWRQNWEATVTKAKQSREALELQRKELYGLNRQLTEINLTLEQQRRNIERQYRIKGYEYEEAFREYMHALRNDYLFPLEHKYLYGIEKYLAGVKSYQAFIRHGNIACFHNDITLVTEEKGLEYIKQMIEIIAILKDRLRPD